MRCFYDYKRIHISAFLTLLFLFEYTATIDQEMRKLFDIPDNVETRLWNRYTANTYEQLAKLDATVQDTGLYSGQPILIERMNPDGSWPRVSKRYNASYFIRSFYSSHAEFI